MHMSWTIILDGWTEYDIYKTSRGGNASEFVTNDPWEVSFLTKKIMANYPLLKNQQDIQHAIISCARMISNPVQRRLLVQCVLKQLDLL